MSEKICDNAKLLMQNSLIFRNLKALIGPGLEFYYWPEPSGLREGNNQVLISLQNLLRLRSHDAGTFWKRWKMWRIGLPFTRKRHIFCRQILKTVDFENGTLTGTFWKRHRVNTWKRWKRNIFRRFQNEADRFLRSRYISFASNSWGDCNKLVNVKFPTVFKLCRYRVNAS